MMMLSQALRLTCSSASKSDPIAYTLYALLLAAVADGGGEAVDGGVKLTRSSSGLAVQLGVSSKRFRMAMDVLSNFALLKYSDKRQSDIHVVTIIIFIPTCQQTCQQEGAADGKSLPASLPVTKKEKETKEESLPRTSFREERKDKKKERLGKEEKKKNAYASLKERREQFWNSLLPFGDRYGSETLQSFYAHWIKRDRATGIMDFESDPKFELEVALHEWHLNRQLFKKGSGRRGSVASEITAEQEQQRKRIREQEASLKVVRERERLLSEMQVVPPVFCQLMKDEGKNLAEVTADEIFTLLSLRRDSRTLTPEQTQAFNDWEIRRNRTAEALRRMESG